MQKEVLVSIKGLQLSQEQEESKLETMTPGTYYVKNQYQYVLFEELVEGYEHPIKTVLKFREGEVQLTKRGLVNVQMLFQTGKKNNTSYGTPFGAILLGIDTEAILIVEDENQIAMKIQYELEVNDEHLADCTIEIHIQDQLSMVL